MSHEVGQNGFPLLTLPKGAGKEKAESWTGLWVHYTDLQR